MINDWYEIWVDESTDVPYILFVSPHQNNSQEIVIIDPKENNKVIKSMPNYNSAIEWLQEDEYTMVNGRMIFD